MRASEQPQTTVSGIMPTLTKRWRGLERLSDVRDKRRVTGMEAACTNIVAVFIDGDDTTVDCAAELARVQGATLHLIALHRTARKRAFGASAAHMRKGARLREEAEDRLEQAARAVPLGCGVGVVQHALAESTARAVRMIASKGGRVAFTTRPDGVHHRAIMRAAPRAGAQVVVLDAARRVVDERARWRVARRLPSLRRAPVQ